MNMALTHASHTTALQWPPSLQMGRITLNTVTGTTARATSGQSQRWSFKTKRRTQTPSQDLLKTPTLQTLMMWQTTTWIKAASVQLMEAPITTTPIIMTIITLMSTTRITTRRIRMTMTTVTKTKATHPPIPTTHTGKWRSTSQKSLQLIGWWRTCSVQSKSTWTS